MKVEWRSVFISFYIYKVIFDFYLNNIIRSNNHANAVLFYNWLLLWQNGVKHLYHNWLDETFMYHEKKYQIIWDINFLKIFVNKKCRRVQITCIVFRVHLSNYKLVKFGVKSGQVLIQAKNSVGFDWYFSIETNNGNTNIAVRLSAFKFLKW